MHTRAIEDYLKTIYGIQAEQSQVATTVLADRLGVAPASATHMVKKLAEMELVAYQPYYGLTLTERGQRKALKILRCHRLVELYLVKMLGLSWDQVHAEADKWEHVLSKEMEDRLDAALGYPTADPHGAPIPDRNGAMPQLNLLRLTELKPGQTAFIAKVSDHNSELLRYLGRLGLYPGAQIKVVAITPRDGLVTVRIGDSEHALGMEAAGHIFVTEAYK